MPLILWEFLINHLIAVPFSLLSAESDLQFLIYGQKGKQHTAAVIKM